MNQQDDEKCVDFLNTIVNKANEFEFDGNLVARLFGAFMAQAVESTVARGVDRKVALQETLANFGEGLGINLVSMAVQSPEELH